MSDPKRWLDDALVPEELRVTLARAGRTRDLDRATRARVGARLNRLGLLPLGVATWLGVKSAAALGIAAGVTAAGALAVAEHYRVLPFEGAFVSSPPRAKTPPRPRSPAAPSPLSSPSASLPSGATADAQPIASPSSEASPSSDTSPSSPALNPSADLPRSAKSARPAAALPANSAELGEESALLERARRALSSAPAATLVLLREHAERFPRGQLAAERHLIEVDALYRVGRKSEAIALAHQLLATSGSELYSERVERLLEKMNAGGASR
jgi:hypothetical protein